MWTTIANSDYPHGISHYNLRQCIQVILDLMPFLQPACLWQVRSFAGIKIEFALTTLFIHFFWFAGKMSEKYLCGHVRSFGPVSWARRIPLRRNDLLCSAMTSAHPADFLWRSLTRDRTIIFHTNGQVFEQKVQLKLGGLSRFSFGSKHSFVAPESSSVLYTKNAVKCAGIP